MQLLLNSNKAAATRKGFSGGFCHLWGFADPVVAAPSSAVAVLQQENGGEGEGLGRFGLVGSGLFHIKSQDDLAQVD